MRLTPLLWMGGSHQAPQESGVVSRPLPPVGQRAGASPPLGNSSAVGQPLPSLPRKVCWPGAPGLLAICIGRSLCPLFSWRKSIPAVNTTLRVKSPSAQCAQHWLLPEAHTAVTPITLPFAQQCLSHCEEPLKWQQYSLGMRRQNNPSAPCLAPPEPRK